MHRPLPRRRRRLRITAGWALGFAALTALGVWIALRPEPTYRPGEDLEGLTAQLARSLPPDYPPVTFTKLTRESGITFRHFPGRRTTELPEDYGSGAAWGDYDGDGWLDLYVVNFAGPITLTPEEVQRSPAYSTLYHNNGDGTFTDVSAAAGVDLRSFGMAAAWGDYNADGRPDLFVSSYGRNVLYANQGDGTFADRTAEAGLDAPTGFWTGAAWSDYDRDGYLDLYVTQYVEYIHREGQAPKLQYDVEVPSTLNPSSYDPAPNFLYHNNGDGTFTEVAGALGVQALEGRSLGAVWSDFDADGWPDLYVANDVSDNIMYHNLGDGMFEDISHPALVADYRGAMGLAVGDWDGDADLDIFVTHWIAQENALYSNLLTQMLRLDRPAPDTVRFMDEADRYGLGQIALDFIGWGTSFFDYDNDGRLDLFVANGSTFQDPEQPELLIPMRDQLFWNRGPQDGYYDVSLASGAYFGESHVGRGAAFADYDNDGDIDVFIVNLGDSGVLLRNDYAGDNHWLEVHLEGRSSNRQAVGARVRAVAGYYVQVRELGSQSSYLSQNSPVIHFGLGDRTVVDSLEIIWPRGGIQTMTAVPADQILQIVEGEAETVSRGAVP